MHHAGYFPFAEGAPRAKLENHGSRRFLLAHRENAVLRHHQVHARPLHGGDVADGARQFPLEGAPQIDALLELRRAKMRFVEDLETYAAAARKPLPRELEP